MSDPGRPLRKHVPRIDSLKVRNFRALQSFELKKISPLTALLGPNGSGKSTVFDVFAFLAESFTVGLRQAVDKRGRFRELRTRGQEGHITFELKYREQPSLPLITYYLAIGERGHGPFVAEEWLQWKRGSFGRPFRFLEFREGKGRVISGDLPGERDDLVEEQLDAPEMLAVNTLGQFARHPRVSALRRFISGWYLSYLSADNTRGQPEAGPQERLTSSGDNLPNVIQFLKEQHPERIAEMLRVLSRRVPHLERIDAEPMRDGRLLLQVKDAPFQRPVPAKFASDGTLKMLAYLTFLYDPDPPPLVGIEEPENQLHPRLLPELAEEARMAAARSHVLVTSHSPFFVDGLKPEELWVLYRDSDGHSHAGRASEMKGILDMIKSGASLGQLWLEGFFELGDPLTNAANPVV